jgi:uncharacterized protein YdhG (YjbR/CyaY superfamily)
MATPFESIDEYIAAQPETTRSVLARLRSTIADAVPNAAETISYNIPTFKLQGKAVLHFACWKTFVSIYPANARLIAQFGEEIGPYLAAKSTLRFPIAQPLPVSLIRRVAQFRAAEISAIGERPRERSPTRRRRR